MEYESGWLYAIRKENGYVSCFCFYRVKREKEEFTKRTGQKTIDLSIGSPQILPDSSIMQVMREAVSQPETINMRSMNWMICCSLFKTGIRNATR